MGGFLSVDGECVTEKVIEKSRFITHSMYVESEESAKAYVAEISRKYSDATHNCYAYIADDGVSLFRFSDDGEPQGTAGMPMLEVLKARKLAYTAVVVTRYFGGIKLGAGGLVRAYSGCVAENLNAAKIKKYLPCSELKFAVSYSDSSAAARYFKNNNINVLSCDYANDVTYTVVIRQEQEGEVISALCDVLNGRVKAEKIKSYVYPFEA